MVLVNSIFNSQQSHITPQNLEKRHQDKDNLKKIQTSSSWKQVAKYGAIVGGAGIGAVLLFLALRQGKGSPSTTISNHVSTALALYNKKPSFQQGLCPLAREGAKDTVTFPPVHLFFKTFPMMNKFPIAVLPFPPGSPSSLDLPSGSDLTRTNETTSNHAIRPSTEATLRTSSAVSSRNFLTSGTLRTNPHTSAPSEANRSSVTTEHVYHVLTIDAITWGTLIATTITMLLQNGQSILHGLASLFMD